MQADPDLVFNKKVGSGVWQAGFMSIFSWRLNEDPNNLGPDPQAAISTRHWLFPVLNINHNGRNFPTPVPETFGDLEWILPQILTLNSEYFEIWSI